MGLKERLWSNLISKSEFLFNLFGRLPGQFHNIYFVFGLARFIYTTKQRSR